MPEEATGNGTPSGTPDPKPSDDNGTTRDLTQAIQSLLSSHQGDASKALAKLLNDNYRLREQRRELKAELGKVKPLPDGAVVLTGDDAKSWEAYKALGAPKEVETRLKEGETNSQELLNLRRHETIRNSSHLL